MPVIVTVHQPEHLPWLGFFAKIARADLWVSLDSVPFRKRYFQNRNRVLGSDGRAAWVTVPVHLENHFQGRIADVEVVDEERWRRKYMRTLEHRYGRHAGNAVYDAVVATITAAAGRLRDLNHQLISALGQALDVRTPMITATELGGAGKRSELLADLTRRAGGDVYLSGPSGRDYLDFTPFHEAGIEVWFHDYDHPTYPQAGSDAFVSHLSALDLLLNCGERSAGVLMSGSRMAPASADATPPPAPAVLTARPRG